MTVSSKHLWFLDTLVQIRISCVQGADQLSVIEHRVPHGDSPPLHSHTTEDELFHVMDGEFLFQVGDQQQRVSSGAMLLVPKQTPHSYRAESSQGGRFLTVTCGGDFERFITELSRPATEAELPSPAGPPTPEAISQLVAVAGTHHIVIHGPPLLAQHSSRSSV